jgi:Arc/MetJ-type ribon-helix-helix transcriptional regulator
MYYIHKMKLVSVRLPDDLADDIEAEARRRKMSKTDVIRERLTKTQPPTPSDQWRDLLSRVAGSVEGPADLSSNVKKYLKSTGYGRNRSR